MNNGVREFENKALAHHSIVIIFSLNVLLVFNFCSLCYVKIFAFIKLSIVNNSMMACFPVCENLCKPSFKRLLKYWQERADRISTDHSKGLSNWAWQTHGQVTATLLPPLSAAASSGFSISATFPSNAIFPTKSMNSTPQSLSFTSSRAPISNASQYYYQAKPPQAPP